MQSLIWNLQLFAEGGADTGASEGTAIPSDTGVETGDAAQNQGVNSDAADQSEETENPETTEESFEDLINGKYKKEYKEHTSKIIRDRLKGTQNELDDANKFRDSVSPVLQMLAEQYHCKPEEVETITQKMMDDNARYEEEALERGMDVDTLKGVKQLEYQNQVLEKHLQQAEVEARRREDFERINLEAEDLKQLYPNFDLQAELENPETGEEFARRLDLGFGVKNTFESIHLQEILSSQAQAIANKEAERVASSVKANGKRPVENGLSQHQPQQVSKNPGSLSREELDAIIEKSKSQRITF